MDRAQQPFTADGLDVPTYVAFGNHDALVQGNAAANAAFEQVATGCLKPIGPVSNPENVSALLASLFNPANLLASLLTGPQNTILVPGDPNRRFVSKKQYKDVFKARLAGRRPRLRPRSTPPRRPPPKAPPATTPGARRRGCASSPSTPWPRPARSSPRPANRLPTGTSTTPSSNGCAGSCRRRPQPTSWWCSSATTRRRASSPISPTSWRRRARSKTRTGTTSTPAATSTRASRSRSTSRPTLVDLLHEYPNAIAWVAGHSHDNLVNPFPNPSGPGGFWSIRVAAEADWPQQSRLLEVFDNHDGTLSIFGTILDHVGQAAAPAPGTPASAMDFNDLASAARTMSFNDLQSGAPIGEGQAERPQRRAADRRPALDRSARACGRGDGRNYSCGRAIRRWSSASSSTAGSTPCSSATSRSERPDSAAVLTMSAARS